MSGFSPLSIPWHSAWWASDPSWTPPADGAAVSDWRNAGTSAANATQATGTSQPTYRAAYTNLNGKPAVGFDGTADHLNTATPSIAQPNHMFTVAWLDPTHGTTPTIVDAVSGTSRHIIQAGDAGGVTLYAGNTVTIPGRLSGPFAITVLFNAGASTLRVNGTGYTVPSSLGGAACNTVRLGRNASSGVAYWKGAIAFLGVSDTELTAQQITDLETWAKNYYGVPIP